MRFGEVSLEAERALEVLRGALVGAMAGDLDQSQAVVSVLEAKVVLEPEPAGLLGLIAETTPFDVARRIVGEREIGHPGVHEVIAGLGDRAGAHAGCGEDERDGEAKHLPFSSNRFSASRGECC